MRTVTSPAQEDVPGFPVGAPRGAPDRGAMEETRHRGHRDAPGRAPAPICMTVAIEADIARARIAARDLCRVLGTSAGTLQRVVTIVSELTRNMLLHAGGGELSLVPCPGGQRRVEIVARDEGPGIADLAGLLAGRRRGLGLIGSKRLADRFAVETGPDGTQIRAEAGDGGGA